MAERKIINGWIVERQDDGSIVTIGRADAPQSAMTPRMQQQQVENERNAAKDAQDAADKAADNARADRQLQLDEEKAAREAAAAQRDEKGTAKQLADWRSNLTNIGLLEEQAAALRKQYEDNFKGKGLQSIAESYSPAMLNPEYAVFDTTAQSMIADMAKAKGLTSQQFNTPAEQKMFFEPLLPKRGDPDEVIVAKLDYLDKMIASGRTTTENNLGMTSEGSDPGNPTVTDPSPDDLPPANEGGNRPTPWDGPNAGPGQTIASGQERFIRDERLASTVDSLMNAGASKAMIDAVLKEKNFPPILQADYDAAKKWMAENPGEAYYGADPTRSEDLTIGQRISGSPFGSFLANYANTASAGTAAALAGEKGKGAIDAMNQVNPTASLFGNLTGGITGALGAEAVIGAKLAGTGLRKFAPRLADSGYGAAMGFNTADEGEGLQNAAIGAVAAPIAGALGERAMRAVGSGCT